jgi:hypothetical protein
MGGWRNKTGLLRRKLCPRTLCQRRNHERGTGKDKEESWVIKCNLFNKMWLYIKKGFIHLIGGVI